MAFEKGWPPRAAGGLSMQEGQKEEKNLLFNKGFY